MLTTVDEDLVRQAHGVVDALKRLRLTVVTAESCTGGLIAALLTYCPGASECVQGGFVVYTKDCKAIALGVPRTVLRDEGSVNGRVAAHLAGGALERSSADIALAVTGVLGPDPDEDGNPAGRVFFCVASRRHAPVIAQNHFSENEPDGVRRAVIVRALALLGETIQR